MSKFLVGGGYSPIPSVGKTLYKLCKQVFIYNQEALCTSTYIMFQTSNILVPDVVKWMVKFVKT